MAKDRNKKQTGPVPKDKFSIRFSRHKYATKLGIAGMIHTTCSDYGSHAFIPCATLVNLMASLVTDCTIFKASIPTNDPKWPMPATSHGLFSVARRREDPTHDA